MNKLFVFLRSDLESMSAGKACAQVAHAASQAAWTVKCRQLDTDLDLAYESWEATARGFGTTIVLDGGSLETRGLASKPWEVEAVTLEKTIKDVGLASGIVHDPSYPVRDGGVTHLIPLDTCFWIFGDPDDDPALATFLSNYSLY